MATTSWLVMPGSGGLVATFLASGEERGEEKSGEKREGCSSSLIAA